MDLIVFGLYTLIMIPAIFSEDKFERACGITGFTVCVGTVLWLIFSPLIGV